MGIAYSDREEQTPYEAADFFLEQRILSFACYCCGAQLKVFGKFSTVVLLFAFVYYKTNARYIINRF